MSKGPLRIDSDKCKRDGICVQVCPPRIIAPSLGQDPPIMLPGKEDFCQRCYACVVACPHNALSIWGVEPEELQPVDQFQRIGLDQMGHLLRSRRSIRVYKDQPVPRETILRLIDMVRYAPSGHNRQSARWLIIDDRERIRQLARMTLDFLRQTVIDQHELAAMLHLQWTIEGMEGGVDRVCREAPVIVVAYGNQTDLTTANACVIALAEMELAARALDLGACWLGYFNWAAGTYPPMIKTLELPEYHRPFGSLAVGYPKFKYYRIPPRNQPRVRWLD